MVPRSRRPLAVTEACSDEVSTKGYSVGGREGVGVRDREEEFKGLQIGDKIWSKVQASKNIRNRGQRDN